MLDHEPMITTIIPTYHRPKHLRRAATSVLNQTFSNLQVCIYDNASGDETASVVCKMKEKDPRINYHCHNENIGAQENFQYGLKRVDTAFFSLLCDDDLLCPDFYMTAIEWFKKYPEAGFVAMGVLNADNWGHLRPDGGMSNCKAGLYTPSSGLLTMIENGPPILNGILFRKSILDDIGLFNEDVGSASDIDFIFRAAAQSPFIYDPLPSAIFIPASLAKTCSFRSSVKQIWPGRLKMINNLITNHDMPDDVRRRIKETLTAQMNSRLFDLGIAAAIRGDFDETRKAAFILHNDSNCIAKSIFLGFISNLCRIFKPLHFLIVLLYKIRSLICRYKNSLFSKLYSKYHSLLDL